MNSYEEIYRQGKHDGNIIGWQLIQLYLAIKEKILGSEHPSMAMSFNKLAAMHYRRGDYAKAEPLFLRALAIRETLGSDHPDVANSLNNLAVLYDMQGDYTKAEPLYWRALAIREKVLAPEHPDLANSLQNYTALLKKLNRAV